MNGPENTNNPLPMGAVTINEAESLREEVQSLKFMLTSTLLLSFIFSFVVFIFLMRQNSAIAAQTAQVRQMVTANSAQAAAVYNKLADYARTHPDYAQQVFQKYS